MLMGRWGGLGLVLDFIIDLAAGMGLRGRVGCAWYGVASFDKLRMKGGSSRGNRGKLRGKGSILGVKSENFFYFPPISAHFRPFGGV